MLVVKAADSGEMQRRATLIVVALVFVPLLAILGLVSASAVQSNQRSVASYERAMKTEPYRASGVTQTRLRVGRRYCNYRTYYELTFTDRDGRRREYDNSICSSSGTATDATGTEVELFADPRNDRLWMETLDPRWSRGETAASVGFVAICALALAMAAVGTYRWLRGWSSSTSPSTTSIPTASASIAPRAPAPRVIVVERRATAPTVVVFGLTIIMLSFPPVFGFTALLAFVNVGLVAHRRLVEPWGALDAFAIVASIGVIITNAYVAFGMSGMGPT